MNAVRDLPIIARIASELRNHGPQWIADTLADLSLPPETELAPRIIPNAMPEVWEAMCKSSFGKFNFEDSIYAILAQEYDFGKKNKASLSLFGTYST